MTGDSRLSDKPDGAASSEVVTAIPAALKAVQKILQLTGDTLPAICQRIETVSTQHDMRMRLAALTTRCGSSWSCRCRLRTIGSWERPFAHLV